ncbi:MAG: hypothetical protein JWR26_2693 [Pedosphaera sp.]|nr:hypothetical protein [Pedosphaera sp.]
MTFIPTRTDGALHDCLIVCQNSEGVNIRATLVKLSRFNVVFEIYGAGGGLRLSEVLADFKVVIHDRTIYSGRASIRSLVNTGQNEVCEATLDESAWTDLQFATATANGYLRGKFDDFMKEWQRFYRIVPEFKAVMADMQSFLSEMRLWSEQVELEIRTSPAAAQPALERRAVDELTAPVVKVIDTFVDRFETLVADLDPDLHPVHCALLRRQLHPLVLSSPFAHRTFYKPLGYAGDYGMVDMMVRPPHEGETLFAKIINTWLLGQAPAQAHRNRVVYLTRKLYEEAARTRSLGRRLKVYNVGCGPAAEIQAYLRDHPISSETDFTLLDFNEETLQHGASILEGVRVKNNRSTQIQFIRRSVNQLLKEASRPVPQSSTAGQYDFIYCAGLFDYLSDLVCKRLMDMFYSMLAPGGLLVATNVSDALNADRPFRYSMEYILDWHLIYRDGHQVATFAPELAPPDSSNVVLEDTGTNVFIEVRKP